MAKDDLTNIDLNPGTDNQDTTAGEPEPDKGKLGTWPDKLDSDDKRLHAYKSMQGMATSVSQQNKALKEELEALKREKEEHEVGASKPTFLPPDQEQVVTGGEEFDPYDENAVKIKAMEGARTMLFAEVLSKEYHKNPNEFMERHAYVERLRNQNPNRVQTGADLEQLFIEADNIRKNAIRNNVFKGLEEMLGRPVTDEDKAKFKNLFGAETQQTGETQQQQTTGFMPETTGSSATGQDTTREQTANLDQQIEEAKNAGDSKRVADLTFQKALLE